MGQKKYSNGRKDFTLKEKSFRLLFMQYLWLALFLTNAGVKIIFTVLY